MLIEKSEDKWLRSVQRISKALQSSTPVLLVVNARIHLIFAPSRLCILAVAFHLYGVWERRELSEVTEIVFTIWRVVGSMDNPVIVIHLFVAQVVV